MQLAVARLDIEGKQTALFEQVNVETMRIENLISDLSVSAEREEIKLMRRLTGWRFTKQ